VKFFLDHDVPAEIGRVLSQVGHEVIELRQVLPPHASDFEALDYAREHCLFLITCNRDDFLALAADQPNPGIIILVRRRSRHAECGHRWTLETRLFGQSFRDRPALEDAIFPEAKVKR
jgi:predicted nuclease of predicted toxin-antitoxin system